MIGKKFIFLLFIILLKSSDPTPPFWGGNPQYKVNVTMLNDDPITTWKFTYYYDWTIKSQRYQHQSPHADELCLFAKSPNPNDTCTIVFAKDGWSYIVYPNQKFCCKCGNSFGAIRYDWLQNNSKYIGQQNVNGYVCQHWTKQGQYLNHYYNTVGGLPVLFHQIKNNPKNWTFDLKSYKVGPVDQSLFDPQCQNLCQGDCQSLRSQSTNSEYIQ